jgi:hypothetical protein
VCADLQRAAKVGPDRRFRVGENPATDPTLTFTTATGGVNPTWVLLHYYGPESVRYACRTQRRT